jgi:hypothetical protein
MRLKTSSKLAEALNTYRVEFVHAGKERVKFFSTLENAEAFAKFYKSHKIIHPV